MKKVIIYLVFTLTVIICLGYAKSVSALYIVEPSNVSVSYINDTSIKLNYKTNNTNSNYKVQIFNSTLGKLYTTEVNTTSYTVTGLEFGKTYNFYLRIYYKTSTATYKSNWTNAVSATPKADAPVINSITSGDKSVTLNYKVTGSPKGVQIYNGNTKKVTSTTDLSTYKVTGLTNGITYKFLIRNYYDNNVYGPWSAIKEAIPNSNASSSNSNSQSSDNTKLPGNMKKKVIIVIGASQVTRMKKYVTSYTSKNNKYTTSTGTLKFIDKGGSGISYQYTNGLTSAKNYMNKYNKKETEFIIIYPLSGNTIKTFNCSSIKKSNSKIKNYIKNYNSSIKNMVNAGYSVSGYVISMHPVKQSQGDESVAKNTSSKACLKLYRSNIKYYKFNKTVKSIINTSYNSNIEYISVFENIVKVNNEKKEYPFKISYNTTDGVHWDKDTTKKYTNMVLNKIPNL